MATNPLQRALGPGGPGEVLPSEGPPSRTAILDALIARGIAGIQGTPEAESATPLEGYPQLPDPNPNAAPPLYGEAPGEGYLYARAPEFRQAALVHTTPEIVRVMLLRFIETASNSASLPFNQEGALKLMDAALKASQAYLLLDPSVDAEGVPVATKAALQLTAQGQPPAPAQPAAAKPAAGKGGQASGTVKPGAVVGSDKLPPRVLPGPAGQAEQAMHQHAIEVLRGARPSRPLPQPRPGA